MASRVSLERFATWALFVSAAVLALIHDPGARPLATVGLLLAGNVALVAITGKGVASPPSVTAVLAGALVLRLLCFSLEPTLSTDVWRYLWDGHLVSEGVDPYRWPPDAAELEGHRTDVWDRLDHRDVPTVYPPLALTAFSIAARAEGSVWWWKGIVAGADLATCFLLLVVAGRVSVSRVGVLWYAWNPVVALETAGMGHLDGLAVVWAVGAVAALVSRPPRLARSAVAAGIGALVKLGPLPALPMWARQSGRPVGYFVGAGLLVVLGIGPVILLEGGLPPGLAAYAVRWEFNGPLFEPLWRLFEAVDVGSPIKGGLAIAEAWSGHHEALDPLYRFVYPQFLAKVVLAAVAVLVVARSLRRSDPVTGTGELFEGLVLCSATVYPWYLLWVMPWAALARRFSWLWVTAASGATYLSQGGSVALWPWIYLFVWGPFAILRVREGRWTLD